MRQEFELLDAEEKAIILSRHDASFRKKQSSLSLVFSHKNILAASFVIALLLLLAILGPLLSPYSFEQTDLPSKNLMPSKEHLFGTDELGRDLFTRVSCGLGLSLEIGLIAACVDLFIGVSWGMIAGLRGGTTDHVMMRFAEMIYCLPYLLFVILITSIVGPGFAPIISAMVLIGWIQMARITRNLVLQLKQCEFFTAAISLGVGPFGLIWRHILPNIAGPLTCVVMLTIPQAIFAEAFLSFLGIGIQPPEASLGSLVSDALGSMRYYPWRLFIPACMITLTIFAFNLLGDGLRDLFDPQSNTVLGRGHAKANS